MNTKGKWFVRAAVGAPFIYWTGRGWNADPTTALYFDTIEEANTEARKAEQAPCGFSTIIAQATRDV